MNTPTFISKTFDQLLRDYWLKVYSDGKWIDSQPADSERGEAIMQTMLTPPVGKRYVFSATGKVQGYWTLVDLPDEQLNPCKYLTAADLWDGAL